MAIKYLRKDPRCEDGSALADLISLIEDKLLQVDPEQRAQAPELHEKLKAIVDKAQSDPSYLWKQLDKPPETPKFFVRSNRSSQGSEQVKDRQFSSSSQSSSGSSNWTPGSTEKSLDSVDALPSTGGT
jgi:hypothetical protein